MRSIHAVSIGLTLAAFVTAVPLDQFRGQFTGGCKPFSGTFSIENFMLYPENSDFDRIGCKLYAGSNFNASVLVYDPYTADYEILTFPGITGILPYHISGIDYDTTSHTMFFSANSGIPYQSSGLNLTGPNKVIKYDPQAKKVVYIADLAPFQREYQSAFGRTVSGFQDMAEDCEGNSYVPFNFNGTGIAKIDPTGSVTPFFTSSFFPPNQTAQPYNFVGVLTLPSQNKLLVSDWQHGNIVSFDTTSSSPTPTTIKMSNMPANYTTINCDGMVTPARYPNQEVILCSEDFLGGPGAITVFTSKDGWVTGTFVGAAYNDNPLSTNSTPTATVQIANSIFISEMFFFDTPLLDFPGNRSSFPFIDITSQVDGLVAAEGIKPIG